jgi:hypothetical protein
MRNEPEFTEEETARRRDAVIRRMANTPPQPHPTPKAPAKKAGESGENRGSPQSPRWRGASAAKPTAED